jgi:hypothetical protein
MQLDIEGGARLTVLETEKVTCSSERHWTFTKRRLAFYEITQDGEDEGCLRLQQLPTQQQAAVIPRRAGDP